MTTRQPLQCGQELGGLKMEQHPVRSTPQQVWAQADGAYWSTLAHGASWLVDTLSDRLQRMLSMKASLSAKISETDQWWPEELVLVLSSA